MPGLCQFQTILVSSLQLLLCTFSSFLFCALPTSLHPTNSYHAECIIHFCVFLCSKVPEKENLEQGTFILAFGLRGHSPPWQEDHGGRWLNGSESIELRLLLSWRNWKQTTGPGCHTQAQPPETHFLWKGHISQSFFSSTNSATLQGPSFQTRESVKTSHI